MNIVLCYPVESEHIAQISAAMPNASVIDAGQEHIAEALREADIFCGHAKVPVPWEEVVSAGRLKWIQSSAAGVDHCLVPCVRDSEIPLTSASGVLADQVAEQTVAFLGALARDLPTFFRAQQKKEFIRRPTGNFHGAKVGIIGYGGNGVRIAQVLKPFHCEIHATDWFDIAPDDPGTRIYPHSALDELLPTLDVLILTAPLNEQTANMMNRERFSKMKPSAWLINVARGGLVVEEDLADALEQGVIAGGAIDVTAVEPLPESSRLWEIPNLIITPHVGGQAAWRIDRMTDLFCENLQRYASNRPLLNLVDKSLGFPLPNHRYQPAR